MKEVVICGGGIIGSSIAYFLALKGVKCTVVEQTSIACAASGKAGGFLARDWCDHNEVGPLARASFDLHMQLAEQFPSCDYRKVNTMSVTFREDRKSKSPKHGQNLPTWIDGPVVSSSSLGTTTTTAQVHPYKLTNTFIEEAKRLAGTKVLIGSVEGIVKTDARVTGVKVDGDVLPADVVVIAMGPWTHNACDWLKIPPINGGRAHSVVLRPGRNDVTAHCLFTEYVGREVRGEPELYPRPDGTVYACGFSDRERLPASAAEVKVNVESCQRLATLCGRMSQSLDGAEVVAQQACYLPTPARGHLPVIGRVPETENAYVAAGHTCWGILNAPATGKAMAELIVDGSCSFIDLSPFDPKNNM